MKRTTVNGELKKLSPRYFEIRGKKVYAYDKVNVFDETTIGVPGAKYQLVSFPPGASVAPHFHEKVREVFLIASGKGKITINGKEHFTVAGDIFLIEPNDSHALQNTDSFPFIVHIFKWNENAHDINWK
ncbi:MAG: cupin domain-containing protein [Candidatus Micrarchaeota archaeon]|nr:cupin domain-containing protein [Candidatus Micrarchaeota archaeon]